MPSNNNAISTSLGLSQKEACEIVRKYLSCVEELQEEMSNSLKLKNVDDNVLEISSLIENITNRLETL